MRKSYVTTTQGLLGGCVLALLLQAFPLPAYARSGQGPSQTSPASPTSQEAEAPQVQSPKPFTLVGAVTESATGEPIVGATVLVKGTQNAAFTDLDGKFQIQVTPTDVLQVSFMGFTTKEITVGNQKVLAITLSDDATQLQELVVTAFGAGQSKETLTGSIQSVRPMDLKVPAANLSTAFAGRLSGVIAYQRSGEPGSNGSDFFIRGVATMNGTAPLIIMDGVEISKGDLNALDPEIIESFSVLKDATASAMYGTRGANGVLIIKTKSGQDLDKPVIGFRVESYVNTPIRRPEIVDGVTFMRMYNEAVTNQGTGDPLYTEEKIQGTLNGWDPYIFPNVDWYNEVFKDATFNQKANFNVRGGTSKVTYFMNVNINHETGMMKDMSGKYFSYKNNIDVKKYAFQNNVDFHMSKSATLSLHLNVQLSDTRSPAVRQDGGGIKDVFDAIMGTNAVDFPITYPQDELLDWYRWGGVVAGNYDPVNPVAVASQGYQDTFASTVVANVDYTQKLDVITKGLQFKALVSFKNWTSNTKRRYQGFNKYMLHNYWKNDQGLYEYQIDPIGDPTNRTLDASFDTSGDRRFYLQAYFDYDRTFGKHHLGAMLLYNQDEFNTNVNSELIPSLPKRRMGVAGRFNYDFDNRYLLELNAGYNGSENFAKGHRFGFFPSASIGWNISRENFWEPLKNTVSRLKLRASYGLVGNDQASNARFLYMALVKLNQDPEYQTGYGTQHENHKGPTFQRFRNEKISWEVGEKVNVGADIELFNSLAITVDAFREIRRGILSKKESIPNYLGASKSEIWGNFGSVKNWGVDLAVDYGQQITHDLAIQFRGTFTFARNKVLKVDEAPGLRPTLSAVGYPLNSLRGFVADGLYIDQADIENNPTSTLGNIAIAPGDIKYVDQPDAEGQYDGRITADDMVPIGHPTLPEIIYGFGPSITYKKWDFSLFFQGQGNVSLMMKDFSPFGTQSKNNVLSWIADDYWSMENQNPYARYPRLTKFKSDHNTKESTFWLRDASFLKLKNAEIGFSFKRARLYVSATNLFTLSKFKLWDPEMGGGRGMSYPLQRTYNVGLQVSFK